MNNNQIVNDLMVKVADDVRRAIRRTLDIAPAPLLPIVVSAGATAIVAIAAVLEEMSTEGRVLGSEPDPECVMLAGLICARMAIDPSTGISLAYDDLEILKARAVAFKAKGGLP